MTMEQRVISLHGNITLTLTPEEEQAFKQLLDAALRAAGIGALTVVSHFSKKLEDAKSSKSENNDAVA